MAGETFEIGKGGWVRYRSVRLAVVVDLRYTSWVIDSQPVPGHGLAIAGRPGVDRLNAMEVIVATNDLSSSVIDTNTFRGIPFGRIDAWANGPTVARKILHAIGTDLGGLRAGPRTALDKLYPKVGSVTSKPRRVDATLRVGVPTSRPFGDAFYKEVARVYAELATTRRDPAAAIADANEVQVSQVHRWIKVAREKGFLARGRHGKAG